MFSLSQKEKHLPNKKPRLAEDVQVQQKLSLCGFNPAQRVVGSLFLPVSFMLKRRPTSHNALLLSGHRRHSTRLRGEGGLHLTSASRPSLTLLLVFSLVPLIRPVRTGGELLVGGRPVRGVQQRPVENGRSQSELAWSATSSPL